MHFSEMSDVVMVKRIMMMLVMGAGFQFSSLTSGVVGQSVTAGDQQQSHYSSIVTQAQSTTQNSTQVHIKQHTTSTRTVRSKEHTQNSTSTAHKRTGETSTAHSTQEHKAQHIKEQESTACLIYCHTGASGISSTHAPDQLTTPLVCNKVISDYLCSFA